MCTRVWCMVAQWQKRLRLPLSTSRGYKYCNVGAVDAFGGFDKHCWTGSQVKARNSEFPPYFSAMTMMSSNQCAPCVVIILYIRDRADVDSVCWKLHNLFFIIVLIIYVFGLLCHQHGIDSLYSLMTIYSWQIKSTFFIVYCFNGPMFQ